MIQFEHVSKSYGKKTILKDLNFTIDDGKFIVFIGTSGCGKTTTLKTINRLIDIDKGRILIDGKDIKQMDKVTLRRHIGYVIQQIGLFPNMTVAQNISVVPKMLGKSKEECNAIVDRLLKLVHMESFKDKYPSQMSGGQQQRIGVLRALAGDPPMILMDEPFGALDPITRDELQDELKTLQQELQKTIIFVTHDMDEALKLGDEIVFMDQGQIVQMASPEEMLKNPASDKVKDFLGKHTSNSPVNTKVSDFMRKHVIKVLKTKGIRECIETMARNNIDSLIVVDKQNHYEGTVDIKALRYWDKDLQSIEPLIRQEAKVVNINDEAKESFDYLIDTKEDYVIVVDDEQHVMGIVTKTSVARSVAQNIWGA